MKIIFSSLSGYAHVYPLLPLALAAREVGHDVIYATGERFHSMLEGLGFPIAPVGIPIRDAFGMVAAEMGAGTGGPPPGDGLEPAARALHEILPRRFAADLLPVLRAERPDLVVYEALNPGAGLAAHRAGIPAVCHANTRAEALDRSRQRGMELLRAVAAEIGVESTEDGYLLGDRYLDIFPPSLQEPSFLARAERTPLRPVAFGEAGELPEIVLAERKRPLVYLTLGTVVGTAPVLRAAIDGLSALDVDVVVAAAGPKIWGAEFGALASNVHFGTWVPQADLLPLVDLVVHHGGSGTTLGAAGVGVPQLFLPAAVDGFHNAGAVSAAGAGIRLLPGRFEQVDDRGRPPEGFGQGEVPLPADVVSAEVVAEAADRLLTDPETGQAAKTLAEEIAAMPSPAEVATRLPEFR
ncbi:glycosyltransferase [Nocardia bovistercoris]|uniref:Glycosyltransferase family 1 protein n=1 Tax=Nocardia bovistercoris TaxID=2785916 RepID=A0A931N4L3_9NOCA|nr:glycosyltransferase [Nocardia bovistercoris]MBH0781865.1 glycosyltransferase family 1 protein [Nocardia bovistercoris]